MKIIRIEGRSKVVELPDGNRRVIPSDSNDATYGAPYGIPFALALVESGIPQRMANKIERELHKRNIWTLEDLEQNPSAAMSSIQAAYSIDVQKLLSLVKRYRR